MPAGASSARAHAPAVMIATRAVNVPWPLVRRTTPVADGASAVIVTPSMVVTPWTAHEAAKASRARAARMNPAVGSVRVPGVREADAEPRGDLVRADLRRGDAQAHQRFALGPQVAAVRYEADAPQEL